MAETIELPVLEAKCIACDGDGWVSNAAETAAWEARYDAAMNQYKATAGAGACWTGSWEESEIQRDAPDECVGCVECEGTGRLLTDAGRALLAFLDRHRNVEKVRADLRALDRTVKRGLREANTCRRCNGLGCGVCV